MLLELYRKDNNLTYARLAKKVGLSPNMTWRICQGKAPHITLQHASMITEGTGLAVTMSDLMLGIGGD